MKSNWPKLNLLTIVQTTLDKQKIPWCVWFWKSPTKIENIGQWEVFSLKKNTFEWQDARSEVNLPLGGKSDQKYHLLFWSQSWLNKLHSHIWGNIPLNRKIPKESFFSPKIVFFLPNSKIWSDEEVTDGTIFFFCVWTQLRWVIKIWARWEQWREQCSFTSIELLSLQLPTLDQRWWRRWPVSG